MDKYEYKLKTEQMLELMEDGSYSKAAEIADSIDWKRVRNTTMLMNVSDIYEKSGEYQKSYEVLNIAYHRAEGSRKIVYRLCTLALKTKNLDEAIDYYDNFIQLAPKDPNQYILKYQILRAQRAPIEQQIDALESFKKAEYIEVWAYELAKLYQEAGMIEECLEECDDIILWFSEGKYVYKAMEMKMQYKPLTPSQQEKYDRRFDKVPTETEEMPDLSVFVKKKDASAKEVEADLQGRLAESQEKLGQMQQETDTEIMPVISESLDAAGDARPSQETDTAQGQMNNIEKTADPEEPAHKDETVAEEQSVPKERKEEPGEELVSDRHQTEGKEPGKKKIGQTMKLDEALRVLLSPDSKERAGGGMPDEEAEDVDLSDLKDKIEDIESVADLDMVREHRAEKERQSRAIDADLEELTAESLTEEDPEAEELVLDADDAEELELDIEDAEEMNTDFEDAEALKPDLEDTEEPKEDLEDIGELKADSEDVEKPKANLEDIEESKEDLEDTEEPKADLEDAEGQIPDFEDENKPEMDAEDTEVTETDMEAAEAAEADAEDEETPDPAESIADDTAESANQTEEPQVHSGKEEIMDTKKKKTEPILPPDIQRLIDEIEGVIPPEDEKPKRAGNSADVRERTRKDNMGRAAARLRLDKIGEELDLLGEDSEDEYDELERYPKEEYYEETEEYPEEDYEEAEEYPEEEYYEETEGYPEEEYEEAEEYPEEEYHEETEEYPEEEYEEAEEYPEEEYEEAEEYPEEGYYEEAEEYPEEYEEAEEYSEEEYYEEAEEYPEEEYADTDRYTEEYEEAAYESDEEYDGRFYSAEDALADMEEEFRPQGFADDEVDDREVDDREVPEDEDDDTGVNFLTASVPLSRKETAKLIATGKTAPIPTDEIADALSISDTGFLVHSSRELVTPEGKKHAALTEEQKKLFSYFAPVRGMSEQLVDVLEQDKNCTNRRGTSRTGNLLIIGNKGNGKTVLAVDVVKAIQKQRRVKQGKVAIVTGEALNKKKINDIFRKLYSGALIIEKAGKMNEKTVARLNKAMEQNTGELLVVLEDQRKPLDRLLTSNREFRRKFTSRLEVPVFINDELVTFGQTYAQENGYRIDEMGLLALYSRIDMMQREDHSVTVAEVKAVMDEAMDHSQRASAKKLMKRVFGKNTDDADRIILTEKDFNA